jgi:hypothetical protein
MPSSSSTAGSAPVVYSEDALLFTPADPLLKYTVNVNVNWFAATNGRSELKFELCKAPGFQPRYVSQLKIMSAPTPYNPNSLLKYVVVCAPVKTGDPACVFQPDPLGCIRGSVFGNFSYDASALDARLDVTMNPPASTVFKLNLL